MIVISSGNKQLPERMRYLKEDPKGVSEMCRIMEDMGNESFQGGIKEGMKAGMKGTANRMLTAGKYAIEEIASIAGLFLEDINQLKAERHA